MNQQALIDKIQSRQARIGVVGLGYVGLPLVLRFGEVGFPVIGFDVDEGKVTALNQSRSYIAYIEGSRIETLRAKGLFEATADFSRLTEADCIIICVPTPLDNKQEPDLQYIEATAKAIGRTLRSGQLVVLESTTYPGTTRDIVGQRFAESGLEVGTDYFLAYSPEREDPGNTDFSIQTIPKVIGGVTAACRDVAQALYGQVVGKVVLVSSAETAELVKLLENIYRAVNIAMVNELKLLCDRMGIDVWEAIDAAATKPFGFAAFYPGPGLGGHCIPIDPFYLSWKAREYGFTTRFIELAGEINSQMVPRFVIEKTIWGLNRQGKSIQGARVLVLGVAYKRDVDDTRESPAMEILSLLRAEGANVAYHDPFVPRLYPMRHHDFSDLASVPLNDEELGRHDAVLIVTDHTSVDYASVVRGASLVIDTRNATRDVATGREKIVKA